MAMRYSPIGGVGVRTVVIKLLIIYGPVSGSFLFLKTTVLKQVMFVGKHGILA